MTQNFGAKTFAPKWYSWCDFSVCSCLSSRCVVSVVMSCLYVLSIFLQKTELPYSSHEIIDDDFDNDSGSDLDLSYMCQNNPMKVI